MNNNPFIDKLYDLGTSSTSNVSKKDIDDAFRMSVYADDINKCIFCGNPAAFCIIPKYDHLNTAEIQDKGFICEHCAKQKYLDPNNYGLRSMK